MTKIDAFKKAESLGYTIRYWIEGDETRLRKPGAAVNSLNEPYEYCRVYKLKRSWRCEEAVDPLMI